MMQYVSKKRSWCWVLCGVLASGLTASELQAEVLTGSKSEIVNGTIGYAMTAKVLAVYTTKEGRECPTGANIGPREQFDVLYPRNGERRQAIATSLAREAEIWFPTTAPDVFEFK